ncbi:hypothetical protein [Flavobacterium sp. XS2P14]|uniref:hypothetical protein n=1 Tax=Flavobacterium sp. XS2P14 TaxID=3401735 RepID=UPI003AAE3F63
MKEKKITIKELENILDFIKNEVDRLKWETNTPDKILIMLPNWFLEVFLLSLRGLYNRDEFHYLKQRFEGIKTQPHYADEIVIFFEDYHINPSFFTPAIYTINFENEENRKEQ